MRRKIFAIFMTLLLTLTLAVVASAEELDYDRRGSVSVTLTEQYEKTPIVGAELSLYHVASVGVNSDGKLNYIYTEAFADAGIDIDDPDLAEKLEEEISKTSIKATRKSTNEEGTALFSELPLGLYLIRQTNLVDGFAPCMPFLVTIPCESERGYVYDVNASPKTEVAKLTSITVRKAWNTDASTKASDSVTVQLLRGGKVLETVVLSEENNWQFTFEEMPESDAYSIKELNVPKGFTATYKQSGYVFTVINTSTLAQTGQLIWPLPVLGISGVLLICVGFALLRKKEK